MTNTENVTTFPRNHEHCMDRTGINYVPCATLTHCPSICECPVSECTAEETNPNRPTEDGYCHGCGRAPCLWTDNPSGTHWSTHGPITLQEHESNMIGARLDAIGPDEMRSALMYLSGRNPQMFEELMMRASQ